MLLLCILFFQYWQKPKQIEISYTRTRADLQVSTSTWSRAPCARVLFLLSVSPQSEPVQLLNFLLKAALSLCKDSSHLQHFPFSTKPMAHMSHHPWRCLRRVDVVLGDMVGLVVLGQWLDSMIFKVFSNLNNSVILCRPQAGLRKRNKWERPKEQPKL